MYQGYNLYNGKLIDEVIVSIMLAPHSYTGDDVVEVSAHGGRVTLNRILGLLLDNGARAAGPGVLTPDAARPRRAAASEAARETWGRHTSRDALSSSVCSLN